MNSELSRLWADRANTSAAEMLPAFEAAHREGRLTASERSALARICVDAGYPADALAVLDEAPAVPGIPAAYDAVTRCLAGGEGADALAAALLYPATALEPRARVQFLQGVLKPFDEHLWIRLESGPPGERDAALLARYLRIIEGCRAAGMGLSVLCFYWSRFMHVAGRSREADAAVGREGNCGAGWASVHWAVSCYSAWVAGDEADAGERWRKVAAVQCGSGPEFTARALACAVAGGREAARDTSERMVRADPLYPSGGGAWRRFNVALLLQAAGYANAASRLVEDCRAKDWSWSRRKGLWTRHCAARRDDLCGQGAALRWKRTVRWKAT